MATSAHIELAAEGGGLIACRACDALLRPPRQAAARSRCPRCRTVLTAPQGGSIDGVLAAAATTIILLVAAAILPFLSIDAGGRHRDAALIDAVEAAGGATWPLAFAVGGLIVALPMTRALAMVWVLAPIRLGLPPARGARGAFRLALELRPWSMIEVFIIGVAVALVKIAGLAAVGLGAAFWILVALAAVALFEDAVLCRHSIWRLLV